MKIEIQKTEDGHMRILLRDVVWGQLDSGTGIVIRLSRDEVSNVAAVIKESVCLHKNTVNDCADPEFGFTVCLECDKVLE